MTDPTEQAPPFSEAARLAERCRDAWAVLRAVPAREGEAALRRHGRKYDAERFIGTRDGLSEDMLYAAKALDAAAVNADPRAKAFLALAALCDEELVDRIGGAFAERENATRYEGGPHTSPMVEPPEYDADDFKDEARAVLTALGLSVAEQEATG